MLKGWTSALTRIGVNRLCLNGLEGLTAWPCWKDRAATYTEFCKTLKHNHLERPLQHGRKSKKLPIMALRSAENSALSDFLTIIGQFRLTHLPINER